MGRFYLGKISYFCIHIEGPSADGSVGLVRQLADDRLGITGSFFIFEGPPAGGSVGLDRRLADDRLGLTGSFFYF